MNNAEQLFPTVAEVLGRPDLADDVKQKMIGMYCCWKVSVVTQQLWYALQERDYHCQTWQELLHL